MKKYEELSEKWIRASVIGTSWAAFEIVLGSFLHNLKVPFSGSLLTAVGLIILISAGYSWSEKGLYWRAGLICAFMKTLSPSAYIFGPMIAIFSEALLLEFSVRMLGRNFAGYLLGAVLAMSWNLVILVFNLIVIYGSDLVGLYTGGLEYVREILGIHADIVWVPLLLLLALHGLSGLAVAVGGMAIGRNMTRQKGYEPVAADLSSSRAASGGPITAFDYSLAWLFLDIVLMFGGLLLLHYTGPGFWAAGVFLIIVIWAFRYRQAVQKLSKPRFWIMLVVITMLAALVFSQARTERLTLWQGILTGLQMNFRAALLIVAFTAIGKELYNPVIRKSLSTTRYRQLPLALELSFESLPYLVAHVPPFRTLLRNPGLLFYQLLLKTESRLAEVRGKLRFTPFVILLTGRVESGKTSCLKKLVTRLRESGTGVGGILAERVLQEDLTTGYDVVDIHTGKRAPFLRQVDAQAGPIGRFSILPEGLDLGKSALSPEKNTENEVVVIDEVGRLELRGEGWSESLSVLLAAGDHHVILAVNDQLVDKIAERWNLRPAFVADLANGGCQPILDQILELLRHQGSR